MHLLILCLCLVLNLLSSTLWADQLEKDLKPLVPVGAGGIVGLLKAGKELKFIPFGQLSVTNPTPVNQDTLTLVASTSKMFVGLLAVRLTELGILSLDTELSFVLNPKHFEIFDDQELAKHITLRQMLTTGNAVVSLINFRPAVPTTFDSRALLALDEMGSVPRVIHTLADELKEEHRELKKQYQVWTMADYDTIYMSKFGYVGVLPVKNGLIMNWNGSTLIAGKVADNRFMLFDDEYRNGMQIAFGTGPYTHLPYLFLENGNDNSQAFKAINKEEALPKEGPAALKLLKTIHGLDGITYQGTRPDGAGTIKLKWNEHLKQISAQSEGNEVPIIVTNV